MLQQLPRRLPRLLICQIFDLDALLAVVDSDSLKGNTRKVFEKRSLIDGIYPIKEARLKLPLCTPLSHHHEVAGDQRYPKAIPPRPRQDKGQAESTARFAIDRPRHRESRQAEQALKGAASSCVISVHPQVMETMSGVDKEGALRSLDTSNWCIWGTPCNQRGAGIASQSLLRD
jgi:hypothetical protein